MNRPSSSAPLHLAIIPDGNRRWAREHKLDAVWRGHEVAVENFRTLGQWCRESGEVAVLTVWCFSTENWKRDPKEIAMLMQLLEKYLTTEQQRFLADDTRFVHAGRRDRIPNTLRKVIEETERLTQHCSSFTLQLAVDYGGKDEVLRAIDRMQAARETPTSVTEETLRRHFDQPTLPDIDLVLRTSGEQRTSNFFLFQSSYAEWIFSPKYFPDIVKEDLNAAIGEFRRRKRRFGN